MSKKEISFEESLKKLQEIADALDREDIGLDESIKLYEEGMELSKTCYALLDKAELKVEELKKKLENDVSGENIERELE